MRTRLAVFLTAIAGLCGIAASAQSTPVRTIYVRDTSHLSAAQIKDALSAVQDAVDEDFYPIWHARAKLVFIGTKAAPKGSWRINIEEFPPCWDCAGFHSYENGIVSAEVGAGLGMNVWGIFTHELWEMLVDPYPHNDGTNARTVTVGTDEYIVETADPVEADAYAYRRRSRAGKSTMISDFVTPEWFVADSDGLWDFTGNCKRPLQILPGGYQLVWRSGSLITLGPS